MTIKYFTFRFVRILHKISQQIFPNDPIFSSCYENNLPTNLRYLLRQEGMHNGKALMQQAQSIENDVVESGVDQGIIMGNP
jgi:hypothetical protein